MPAQLTTRAQVNGYRFLLRRLDHALVRRDVRMLHDPMRAQSRSLISGAILALLVVAGCAILAFIRPQGSIGDASIVVGKDSGALYVVVRDKNDKNKMTLHPVLNLASARLLTESSASPKSVKDSKLDSVPRGPMVGIPGAPTALPGSDQGDGSRWTLCDTVQLSASGGSASTTGSTSTVIVGGLGLGDRIKKADSGTAVLVSKEVKVIKDGAETKVLKNYLLYDGRRAEVDPKNAVMMSALNLAGVRARPISAGLVSAATEVPALVPPSIPQSGQPGPGRLNGMKIGSVIRVAGLDGSSGSDLYVVLAEGRQRISMFAAQVIRSADSQGLSEIPSIAPDLLADVPIVPVDKQLPVNDFPSVTPKIISAEESPVSCISWARESGKGLSASDAAEGATDRATTDLLLGTRLPLPGKAVPVAMASTDTTGDRLDEVYVPPASGEFIRVTGIEPGSQRRDSLFYVTDIGIRYGIDDLEAAKILGLGTSPRLAPWSIVEQLVPGPTLTKAEAMVQRDVQPTG